MIGYQSTVEANVVIGANVIIGSHSILKDRREYIQDHVILGKRGFATPGTGSPGLERKADAGLIIGRNYTICSQAVCYLATTIGDHAILADGALIRELVTLHEGVRVGKYAIVEWGAIANRALLLNLHLGYLDVELCLSLSRQSGRP